MIKFLPLNRLL